VGLHHLTGIDALVEDARGKITRLSPAEAYAAWQDGALLVDTRSSDQLEHGAIPGVVRHALSVVLWRLDELPRETRVILICRHGESSSLAAAQLVQMGFRDAADVIGGARAWRAAGLPVVDPGGGDQGV
jgi:rhodanese-related sulfurtransferase